MSKWTKEQANSWYENQGWIVGCNFLPSSAINQLEMFQDDTFDIETIKKEITWASDLGFNSLRIYLHDLLWTWLCEQNGVAHEAFLLIFGMFAVLQDYQSADHGR